MRLTFVALTLLSACGSDLAAPAELGVADLSIGDLAAVDLGDCPPSSNSNGGPTAGPACAHDGERCGYFEAYCDCSQQEQRWICCWVGVLIDCPAVAPTPGDRCCDQYPTRSCAYACNAGLTTTCSCVDDHWQCATAACD